MNGQRRKTRNTTHRIKTMLLLTYTSKISDSLRSTLRDHHVGDLLLAAMEGVAALEIGTHWSLRNGLITFCPKGRTQGKNDKGEWCLKGRQEIKPSKLVVKLLGEEEFTSRELSDFSIHCMGRFQLKFLLGEELASAFSNEYCKLSCMSHRNPKWFEIYSNNPEVCSMAVLENSKHEIVARCIIWTQDGIKYREPIYAAGGEIKDQLEAELDDLGVESADDLGTICLNTDCDYWPYMDTFIYIGHYHISSDPSECFAQAQNQDGSRTDLTSCSNCRGHIDTDCVNAYLVKYDTFCQSCFGDSYQEMNDDQCYKKEDLISIESTTTSDYSDVKLITLEGGIIGTYDELRDNGYYLIDDEYVHDDDLINFRSI